MNQPADQDRAAAQASDLTLEEKVALSMGADFWHTAAVPRLGVPAVMLSDGPHGLRAQDESADNLGIGDSIPATCFPTASALASSWNPGLAERVGQAIGREARAQGVAVVLGPGVNIKRSPLCGRNFEYFSEDPLLAGALGAAWVSGLQTEGVGASLKHLAVNNQETERLRVSAEVDERTLREIYLPAFEHVVTRAHPWTVMCSYNKINGTWASENHRLLTEILRQEWGFDGLVVSDWGAVVDRARALRAGLDLEMPPNHGVADVRLLEATRSGEVDEADLDASTARVLALAARAPAEPGPAVDHEAQHDIALQAARESLVLLKNEAQALPLGPEDPPAQVAVIGALAETPRYQGAGSSQVNATWVETPLAALRELAPQGVSVGYAAGYRLDEGAGNAGSDDTALTDEAVAAARAAEAVVVVLGLTAAEESEGFDRTHLDLPADQLAVLRAVAAVSDRVVVVLANGGVVTLGEVEPHAQAILEGWLPGQAGGRAVAEVLWGWVAPSGRLAETIPLRLQDSPAYLGFPGELGRVRYGEGVFVGYRGYDARDQAVGYPFGHGLGYTTFAYDELALEQSGSAADGDLGVLVSCRITNSGSRAGAEVVQVYLGGPSASVLQRPPRELGGFAKVHLAPGESTRVSVRLDQRRFAAWRPGHGWWVEAGERTVEVGSSSRDVRLAGTVTVDASPLQLDLDLGSSLQEWLDDPELAAGLADLVAAAQTPDGGGGGGDAGEGAGSALLSDPGTIALLGNFPMDRMVAISGGLLDRAALERLVAQRRERHGGSTTPR